MCIIKCLEVFIECLAVFRRYHKHVSFISVLVQWSPEGIVLL